MIKLLYTVLQCWKTIYSWRVRRHRCPTLILLPTSQKLLNNQK